MTGFLQHNGEPLKILGYGCLFGTTITYRGQDMTFARDAFSPTLRYNASGVRALVDHKPASEWACTQDGSLRLWEDGAGVAFSAKIPNTIEGRGLARAVADGLIGASLHFRPFKTKETASGYVIQAATLTEISLTTRPAFATAAWLVPFECMNNMSDHALMLRRRWSEPRHDTATALREMARRVPARKPAPVPLAMHDIYPAGLGFSSAELDEAAFQEAAGRRMTKESQTRTRARQRARRAA